jgi:hypothetical protein
VFALNGQVQGLELFDCERTFQQYLGKLISSYALEALGAQGKSTDVESRDSVEQFLKEVCTAEVESFAALGEGEDVRLTGKNLAGGALVADERVVHLSALALAAEGNGGRARYRQRYHRLYDDDL